MTFLSLVVAFLSLSASALPQHAAPDPARWETAIQEFAAGDAVEPPAKGGIVFAGSSSIRRWTSLAADFPDLPVLNRGFGGSQLPDVITFADRIILPYRPREVVVYCGANDIDAGRTPGQVIADFKRLVALIHESLPGTQVAFISIAPNPARWEQLDRVKAANAGVAAWARTQPLVDYIDVFTHMLGDDGLPKPDIFVDDQLHMNEKGYAIWTEVVGGYLR
jgi:lysophospholipase L1-like esterase